ncbi:unnamed protein product [Clonostachys rosea f. rosea IK726]|uniref:Uncharacterized protein n=1 Tax=Clonostachys rosea f. rosea IK726 TaxID=1349383 RepID=A0ACA9TND7_BIOOC|nr:unnamed protein product [Clonostachys rosea f. rosea IK726]
MGTSNETGIQRFLPSWLRFGKQTEKLADAKPKNPMLGQKIHPNGPPPFLPLYEDLHDTPFKPIRRQEERRVLESVDVIMLQVRKELDKLDPGTLDLIAVEHNIRSCCTVRATFACRTIRYGEDLEMNKQLIMKTREYIKAVVGIVHGPKNKELVRLIMEKAAMEALYYQKALKPCDIKLGTYFEEDPSQYRFIGLT